MTRYMCLLTLYPRFYQNLQQLILISFRRKHHIYTIMRKKKTVTIKIPHNYLYNLHQPNTHPR